MPVQKTMVPKFTCSDGTEFLDEHDANVHEAELTLKGVCDQHGYSASSFTREALYDLLVAHAHDFGVALTAYTNAVLARRTARS
jgi:hypothetical protein